MLEVQESAIKKSLFRVKDLSLVGKLHSSRHKLNPQDLNSSFSIGTNTPKKFNNSINLKPIKGPFPTMKNNKSKSNSYAQKQLLLPNKIKLKQSTEKFKIQQDKSEFIIGSIVKQRKKYKKIQQADNRVSQSSLSYVDNIKKINKNEQIFKDFVTDNNSVCISPITQKYLFEKGDHQISKPDPNYEASLQKVIHNRRYNWHINKSIALTSTQIEKIRSQFHQTRQLQISVKQQSPELAGSKFEMSPSKSVSLLKYFEDQDKVSNSQQNYQQVSLPSYGYIYTRPSLKLPCASIGLQTHLTCLKQLLVESTLKVEVVFKIPEQFLYPPSSLTPVKDLHYKLIQVFSHVGSKPQIISIKKYVNCIMIRDKKHCLLWFYSGKVYFGGWNNEGKNSLGLQWHPSRYIYYGQFENNQKQGYGIMKKNNREVYIGLWNGSQRHGWGKVYDQNGDLFENGEFIFGKMVKQLDNLRKII